MKIILFIFSLLILSSNHSHSKNIWSQLKSFRIYNYQGDAIKISDSTIQQLTYIETNLAETKKLLSKAESNDNTIELWKGHYLAIATFKRGKSSRIMISRYGGFFFLITDKVYFYFHNEARKEWDDFFSKYRKLLK